MKESHIIRWEDKLPVGNVYKGAFVHDGAEAPADVDFCLSDRDIPGVPVVIRGKTYTFVCEEPTDEDPARCFRAFVVGKAPDETSVETWFASLADADLSVLVSPMAYGQNGETYFRYSGFQMFEVWNGWDNENGLRADAMYAFDCALREEHPAFLIASGRDVYLNLTAEDLTADSVRKALQSGHFYVTYRSQLLEERIENEKMFIRTTPCIQIDFASSNCRGYSERIVDEPLTQCTGCCDEDQQYVRLECHSSNGGFIFGQPRFVHYPYTPKMTETERMGIPEEHRIPLKSKGLIRTSVCENRFEQAPLSHGMLLKGNLHLHSTRSDGRLTPEQLIETYQAKGYSFFALTDHEVFTDAAKYNRPDFAVLSGIEAADFAGSYNYNVNQYTRRRNYHIGIFQTDYRTVLSVPDGFRSNDLFSEKDYQCMTVRERIQLFADYFSKRGNMVIFNHPHWSCNYEEDLYGYENFAAAELFNHGAARNDASGESVDHYRYCLSGGMYLYGLSTDDAHTAVDIGGGYVVVSAPEITREAIGRSLEKGWFYSSTGAEITDFRAEGNRVVLSCTNARQIRWNVFGDVRKTECGTGLSSSEFIAKKGDWVWADIEDHNGKKAWTNPIEIIE